MINLGNVEESSPSNNNANTNEVATSSPTNAPPPPSYGSAPPSYGAYQPNAQQGPRDGPAPPYVAGGGSGSYTNRPPAYTSGRGGGGGFGGPRRGGWNNGDGPIDGDGGYRSRLCHNFAGSGGCARGNQCAFVHGDADVRFTSPNSSSAPGGFPTPGGDNQQPNLPPRDRTEQRGGNTFNQGPPSLGSQPNAPSSQGPPPPSYDRTVNNVPPPYHSSPTKMGQRSPPPMAVPSMNTNLGGFPPGGSAYVHSPISPRSPIKLSSPTGTGGAQRYRHEPYSGLGKAFSSENLTNLASGHQSPRGEGGN